MSVIRYYPLTGSELRDPEQIAMGYRLRNRARRLRRMLSPNPLLNRPLETYRNLPNFRRYVSLL